MRKTIVRIPQPCAESWATMTPTSDGRHCAACQKTVVDFTLKTDAEILTYFRQAGGQACGRFGKNQLDRPLAPAASYPTGQPNRWRAWLALAVAAWGLRASPAAAAGSPLSTSPHTAHPRKKASPPGRPTPGHMRGTVRNAATHEPLAGVAVFLKGENRSAITDANGHFSLQLLPGQRPKHTLVLHFTGYQSRTVQVLASARQALHLELLANPSAGAEIVGYMPMARQEREISYGVPVLVDELPTVVPLPTPSAGPARRSFWHRFAQPFRR